MKQFIGCDSHKRYSVFVAMNEFEQVGEAIHVGQDWEQFREFLQELPTGSPIAVEASALSPASRGAGYVGAPASLWQSSGERKSDRR